jgi:hypothetical protein
VDGDRGRPVAARRDSPTNSETRQPYRHADDDRGPEPNAGRHASARGDADVSGDADANSPPVADCYADAGQHARPDADARPDPCSDACAVRADLLDHAARGLTRERALLGCVPHGILVPVA